MPIFTDSEIEQHWHIWQIIRDGSVTLVHQEAILKQITDEFREAGYSLCECDASHGNKLELEFSLRSALGFPAGQSKKANLDAFNDRLSDLDFSDCTGVVVVVSQIQQLMKREAHYVNNILDIFAGQSRYHLCFGNRLVLVVQTDDRNIEFESIGSYRPCWNHRE